MITIEVTDEMNAGYPDGNPNRITLTLKNGEKVEELVKHPAGHSGNPMSDDQLIEKFIRLTTDYLTEDQQQESLAMLWDIENVTDYGKLYDAFFIKKAEVL
jgi:2-methylcitrate dehydratase